MKKYSILLIALGYFFLFPSSTKAAPANICLRVPVLMYHHIQPMSVAQKKKQTSLTVDDKIFGQQMRWLMDRGYKSIAAQDLASALLNKTSLPTKAVVITLDDGYEDAFTYAYPIAQQLGLKLNLMIPTGLLNNPDYLTWDQLKSMVNNGVAFAHNHTWSHASLAKAPMAKREFEIDTAFLQLKNNLNADTKIFAYPYGSKNLASEQYLQKKGYIAAFSTIPGSLECTNQIMQLPRLRIGNFPLSQYGI